MSPRGSSLAHRGHARRLVLAIAGLALALGTLPAITGALPVGPATSAGADDFTVSLNNSRTGWDPNEPLLSPSAVGTFSTSPRVDVSVSGLVEAQPLMIHSLNEVIVATENDMVYGITATAANGGTPGHVNWSVQLGSPFNITKVSSLTKCTDLVPNIGVTGTPVYDPGSGNLYMFANIVSPGTNTPHYYLVAVNASTGAYNSANNIHISGRPSNDSNIKFQAQQEMERPGVLLASDGSIWAAFGSHCDTKPYVGFVTRVVPTTGAYTLWSDESGTTYDQAGIWMGGGGVVQDPAGNVFVTTGNGVSPTKTNTPPGQLAESVIHLAYDSGTGAIKAVDFFSPANAPSLDAADTDFGSGGSVALPFGTGTYPDVLAAPSKDGRIWLLNRDALGGREQGPGSSDKVLSVVKSAGGDWGHPALFADSGSTALSASNASTFNDFLFYVGKDAHMQVFRFGVNGSDEPTLSTVANSTLTYGYTSGSPVVTSNGTNPTSVVVWAVLTVNTSGKTGVGSYLTAYALGKVAATGGTPSSCTSSAQCTLTPIWTSKTFTSAKFTTPASSDGWVYIGTRDGHLLGYAAPTTTAPVLGSTTNLGQAAVGASTNGPVTIIAKHPVTITGVTASTGGSNAAVPGNEFTTNGSLYLYGCNTPVPLPVNLVKGDKLTAYVTYTPAAPGGAGGTVSFATSSTTDPSVDLAVVGNGTQPGLTPSSATVQFMGAPDQGVIPVAAGITIPQTVTFSNLGTIPVTVTSVTPPAAPFTASNLPKAGTVFQPGQSVTVPLSYAPTMGGPDTGQLSIGTSAGPLATVQLNGTGVPAVSKFTAASPVVNFGTIPVGKKATAYVHITNSGNTESAVQGVAPLASPFKATLTPAAQMPFNPGADMLVPVTFTPTRKGTFSAKYVLHWTDVNGSHAITVTLTGTAV